MTFQYVPLPLYEDSDYEYEIALEGNYYTFRLYYNERAEAWFYELRDGESTMLVAGERVTPYYPMTVNYVIPNLTGVFWLEYIGLDKNETLNNPFELYKYNRLFYIYDDGEEE